MLIEHVFRNPGEVVPVILPPHCIIWGCSEPRESERECARHLGEIRAPHARNDKAVARLAKYHQQRKDPSFLAAEAARKREARRRKAEQATADAG